MENKQELRSFHLFAGAGGGILADQILRHRVIGACEIEQYPRDVLLQRQKDGCLPEFPIWDDIRTLDGKPWRGAVDILAGGFPCQDISAAGKGKGIKGERSGLWSEYKRLIGEMQPKFIFAENSPLLRTRGLGTVLQDLADLGYNARWGVLGARHIGAAHRRDRIWVLGYSEREGLQGQPRPIIHPQGWEDEARPDSKTNIRGWKRVVHASDCFDELGDREFLECKECKGDYAECECPGPTMDEWDYQIRDGIEYARPRTNWTSECGVQRMANGVPSRVDRFKAVGNGQVPQCAAMAWRLLTS